MSTAPTPAQPRDTATPLPTAEQLPDDTATLKRMVLELLATLQEERQDKAAIQQRLDQVLRRLYGPRNERFAPDQPSLFPEASTTPETAPTPEAGPPPVEARPSRRRGRPHGRRRLPENLPRRRVDHELSEAERVCSCGQVRIAIGCDTSEQLDWQPASLFVWEHRVHKYACPQCARPAATSLPTTADTPHEATAPAVITAPRPAPPIARGLPGAGLLAQLIVSKYTDHLPLHRQERIYERQGLFLPRSTTCDWLAACAARLQPLYDLMVAWVLQSRWLHTDDTPVKNQRPGPAASATARLWGYLGDECHPYNVFDYTATRKRDGPQQFLADFAGYLHADAFSGYDALYLPPPRPDRPGIVEVACNAHARRKFYEARTSDAARAHQALAYYAQLYEIERQAKERDEATRLRMRQELALPILAQFKVWLEAERVQVLPKSPMAEAIGYALNNWTALVRYTEAGFLSIDNNVAEREMKRIAIGRKNWLFVGSDNGGRTAAALLSFTSTCQRLHIEPWTYLQDVLSRLPALPAERLGELLPDRWQAARTASPDAAASSGSPPSAGS